MGGRECEKADNRATGQHGEARWRAGQQARDQHGRKIKRVSRVKSDPGEGYSKNACAEQASDRDQNSG
jgi:hypothetical protein